MGDSEGQWSTNEALEEEEDGGAMLRVLDKGFAVGKKILLTCLIMTSAPIVVPPILVISALGFACSLPYGFFLASYACTEKLMSKLLPFSSELSIEKSFQSSDGYLVEDDERLVGESVSEVNKSLRVLMEKEKKEDKVPLDLSEEDSSSAIKEENSKGAAAIEVGGEGKEAEQKLGKEAEAASETSSPASETGRKDRKGKTKAKRRAKDEPMSRSSEGGIFPTFAKHKIISPDKHLLTQTQNTFTVFTDPTPEGALNEEQIWRQLGELKKIVGCTTSGHGNCIEQLKALYIFAGVEPPTSFKDPPDLAEINHKLMFLKSIVGVK